MVKSNIKIYKLSYSGEFEEQKIENPLNLFTLYSILAIYSQKAKKMYIWVSKNATHSLKIFIPHSRELFSQKYPNLRILRNITVESGEEPFDFFKLLEIEKDILADHILAQEKIVEPINNEIIELQEKMEGYINNGQYNEAIQASEKLVGLSKQINDKSLQKDQEELILTLSKKQDFGGQLKEIEIKTIEMEKKFEGLLKENKINEAHELVNNFKLEIKNKNINLSAIPLLEKLILKEENVWHSVRIEEESKLEKLTILEKDYKNHLKNEDFLKCEKIIQNATELVDSTSDDIIIKKWNKIRNDFTKQKKEHEENQRKLENQLKEIEKKAIETKKKFAVLLTQNKIVEAHELVNNLKLEIQSTDIDLSTIPVLEKLLLKEEKVWNSAKVVEESSIKKLTTFEKDYRSLLKKEEYDKCSEIVQNAIGLMDSILDDKIIKKWNTITKDFIKKKTEHEKNQAKLKEQISKLQKKIKTCLEKNYLTEAIGDCKELLELADKNENSEITEKYSSIMEDSIKELEETREIVDTLNQEILTLKKKGDYKKGIKKIDSMLEEIEGPDFIDQRKELEKLKEDLLNEYENRIKIKEKLKVLENKLSSCQENNLYKEALLTCEKILNHYQEIGDEKLIKQYNEIREDIQNHHDETVEVVDSLIKEINNLQEGGKVKEGIAKIESMIEEIPDEEFPEENAKLQKLREKLISKNEALVNFEKQLNVLENELSKSQNENNLDEALNTCGKIIQISKDNGKDNFVNKYNKVEQELKKSIDQKKKKIKSLIVEISSLKDKNKFEEIITKIDSLVKEIPESIFSTQKEELFKIKKETFNEIEQVKKKIELIDTLGEDLSISQNENNLHDALTICEKIIQISKDIGKNDIENKYKKIEQELKKNIDKKRKKIDSLLVEISNLKEKEKLDEIIVKIDSLVEEIPESIFSKQKEELFKIKRETELADKFTQQIKEIKNKIQEERKKENFDYAKKLCDEIIKISIENDKIAVATKYTNVLKEINEEIELKNILELKYTIEDLSIKGIESLNNSKFQDSLAFFDKIINLLEKKKK